MSDELGPRVAEAIAYLDNHADLPNMFCVVAPFLLDYRSYLKPKFKPCDSLKSFIHEGTLTSDSVRSIICESDVFARSLHDGKFEPSAFGLPDHHPPAEAKPKYDVCISYANEDREVAQRLARRLKKEYFLDVFFDEFEQHRLVGHQLTEMLYSIYARDSLLCVTLFSKAYAEKDWTRHELRAARDRAAKTRGQPYIFPVVLEQGSIPDDFTGIAYWPFKQNSERKLAEEINARLYEWVERNMVTLEEITEVLNYNLPRSDILDGFRQGMLETEDPEYIQALWVLGMLAVASKDDLVKSVGALLDYVVTSSARLSAYCDSEGRFKVFGTASVRRSMGRGGPLALSREGWMSFLEERAEIRRSYHEDKNDASEK